MPISHSISGVAYWLILLLFLPLVLDALALRGLLDPIQGMLDSLLGFLPNLFASGLILLAGWLVARILRQVVTNLLAAAGLDRTTESFGKLGGTPLSSVVGTVVYALLLIPVVIASLDALQLGAVAAPATQMLATILEAVPNILTGALVIAIAFFVGRFAGNLVSDILGRVGFDNLFVRMGFPRREGDASAARMVGTLVLVATVYLASMEAADDLGLSSLAGLLRDFAVFGGNILLGLVIFALGLYLANLASGLIHSARGQSGGLLATAAKVSIILLSSAMALRQMGIAQDIVNIAFGLLLGAAAVAFALAFGLGARDVATRETERLVRSMKGE